LRILHLPSRWSAGSHVSLLDELGWPGRFLFILLIVTRNWWSVSISASISRMGGQMSVQHQGPFSRSETFQPKSVDGNPRSFVHSGIESFHLLTFPDQRRNLGHPRSDREVSRSEGRSGEYPGRGYPICPSPNIYWVNLSSFVQERTKVVQFKVR
jgi:hypothetical protein